MPDADELKEIEDATYRGYRRAIEEQEARARFNPGASLREGFEQAGDPVVVRQERRRMVDLEGGEDDDNNE